MPLPQDPVSEPARTYEVGYGRPPAATQFKRGNRAAAKRRRKPKSPESILNDIMLETVSVRIGTSMKKMPRYEAFIRSISQQALAGDKGAAKLLILHWVRFNFRPPVFYEADTTDYGAQVRAKIEAMVARRESRLEAESVSGQV